MNFGVLMMGHEEEDIFCKIVHGEIDSAKVWEDNDYLAILDINPNTEGETLLLTKKHHRSYIFDMEDSDYARYMLAVKKVVKLLEKGLGVKRVAIVVEGLGIDHAHVKLYPLHGLGRQFQETWNKNIVYFRTYEGYISTQLGPKKELSELKKLADKINKR
jgi:diadenosine tetraphosphate (Ap4A) HIT family hydrolase